MHHVDSTSFSTSSNQFESSPGSSTSGPLDSLAVVETMKNQLDSTIERLKSEKSVADHEVSVLRLLVSDLEARVSQLLAAQASEAAIFEKHSKEQDALVFDLQASLRKLCGDVAEVRVEPDATTDSLPSSRASMPLSNASNHILLKRIGVLEQYRDRSEDALDRHKRLVDTRVAAITAARDAAYSTVSSLQQECDAHRRLIAAQASDITKLVSQKQVWPAVVCVSVSVSVSVFLYVHMCVCLSTCVFARYSLSSCRW